MVHPRKNVFEKKELDSSLTHRREKKSNPKSFYDSPLLIYLKALMLRKGPTA